MFFSLSALIFNAWVGISLFVSETMQVPRADWWWHHCCSWGKEKEWGWREVLGYCIMQFWSWEIESSCWKTVCAKRAEMQCKDGMISIIKNTECAIYWEGLERGTGWDSNASGKPCTKQGHPETFSQGFSWTFIQQDSKLTQFKCMMALCISL